MPAAQGLLPGSGVHHIDEAGVSWIRWRRLCQPCPPYREGPMQTGQRCGPFQLISLLGHGGMGLVYRGVHEDTGEEVALKKVATRSRAALAAIRREIRLLSQLDHPGIVPIRGAGVEAGLPWYAMALLGGQCLADALGDGPPDPGTSSEGDEPPPRWWTRPFPPTSAGLGAPRRSEPWPLERAASVVARLCDALTELHSAGIVHRDLKPANILLLDEDRPVLLDFGLAAQALGPSGRIRLEIQATAGSVEYTSPEQLRRGMVDARADLYALGCLLYRMVAGRLPFTGRSPAAIASGHLTKIPPPPSRWVAGLPPAVDELVLRLLAKDPRARLGYAADVARALQAIGLAEGASPGGATPRPYLFPPGLAGRERPFSSLQRAAAATFEGRGGAWWVVGESGVGKSRLCLEVAQRFAASGGQVLVGGCEDRLGGRGGRQDVPLEALRGPIEALVDRAREEGIEPSRALGGAAPSLAGYFPAVADLLGAECAGAPELPAAEERARLLGALKDAILEAARHQPALLLLDDLQWCDGLTAELLGALVGGRILAACPLLILGTWRSGGRGGPAEALLRAGIAHQLTLERLGPEGTEALVEAMLGQPPPERLAGRIFRRSEGNPLYAAELLRAAVDRGDLTLEVSGGWQVQAGGDVTGLPLPDSLTGSVTQRLGALSAPTRAFSELAAVAGRSLDLDAVAAVGGLDSQGIDAAVTELLRHAILEEGLGGDLRFAHDALREICLGAIPPERAADLHRALAAHLLTHPRAGREAHLLRLAHHHARGGQGDLARMAWYDAAELASSRGAPEDARSALQDALDLDETPDLLRSRILCGMALWGHFRAGRAKEAIEVARDGLALARRLGARDVESGCLRVLGLAYNHLGLLDEDERVTAAAYAVAVETGDVAAQARASTLMGSRAMRRGDWAEAERRYGHARTLFASIGEIDGEATALTSYGIVAAERSHLDLARARMTQALALVEGSGAATVIARTRSCLGVVARRQGRLTEAEALLAASYGGEAGLHDAVSEGKILCNLANIAVDLGKHPIAAERGARALALARETGNRHSEAAALATLGALANAEGRWDDAVEALAHSLSIRREMGIGAVAAHDQAELAEAFAARGDIDEAFTHLAEALEAARLGNARHSERHVSLIWATLARRARGDLNEAALHLAAAATAEELAADPILAIAHRCAGGHLSIARGATGQEALEAALGLVAPLDLPETAIMHRTIRRLARAQRALEAGRAQILLHGECLGDYPPALRVRLTSGSRMSGGGR